jgi:hypothetical protein
VPGCAAAGHHRQEPDRAGVTLQHERRKRLRLLPHDVWRQRRHVRIHDGLDHAGRSAWSARSHAGAICRADQGALQSRPRCFNGNGTAVLAGQKRVTRREGVRNCRALKAVTVRRTRPRPSVGRCRAAVSVHRPIDLRHPVDTSHRYRLAGLRIGCLPARR